MSIHESELQSVPNVNVTVLKSLPGVCIFNAGLETWGRLQGCLNSELCKSDALAAVRCSTMSIQCNEVL